jgi:hypothetical protein
MISPKNLLFIASHLVVLWTAYLMAPYFMPVTETEPTHSLYKTSSSRRSILTSPTDGQQLLAEFMKDYCEDKTLYEELKGSLQPAADLKAAAIASIKEWEMATEKQDQIEAFTQIQARFYHWLKADPVEAMRFLSTSETGVAAMNQSNLLSVLGMRVFPDVARENGVMNSLDWLTMNSAGLATMWTTLIDEMKDGGGLMLFLQLDESLANTSFVESSGYDGNEWLRQTGASVPFADKDKLLEYVKYQTNEARIMSMLLGFAGSSKEAATWILDQIECGEIPEIVASRMRVSISSEVMRQPLMDMEKRIAARRFEPENENKSRETILGELVFHDVNRLLNEGRDWRFEFRHGIASLEEILRSLESAIKITDEVRNKAHIALYRTLSEENPANALPLLDIISEEQRREVMFSNTWQSFGNCNPDEFIAFLNQLPEPVTEQEMRNRMKGWSTKAYGYLDRFGDDYVEWVAALPSNTDKQAAIDSIISVTRDDPDKTAELHQRFYPK